MDASNSYQHQENLISEPDFRLKDSPGLHHNTVLASAGAELIFLTADAPMLHFGLKRKTMLITHQCLSC